MTTRVAIVPSDPWITPNRINTAGQYVLAAFSILGVTFVLFRLQPYLGNVNVSIAYLVVVLCCAAIAQPGVTLFCGLLSFICYDFFLVPPVFTLQVDAPLRLLDPLAVAAVAIVTCVMAGRSRQRAVQSMVYRETDQARATLLHLVSHNLRTPLATIKTALTSLIALDQLPPDSLQLLLDADQECDRLNRLIGNVLHISRMDAKAIRIHRDWNALDEVISAVFTRWPQAVKGGSLRAHMPDSVPLVSFDFSLMEAILGNLVENAFHHGYPPVQVTVSTSPDEIRFCVEDSGTGVPATEQAKLFTQFSSSNSSRIGLGLAVCKGLVEVHSGRIWATFEPRKTRFYFTLPAVYYQDMDDDTPADR